MHPPLPGEVHPFYAEHAEAIRSRNGDRYRIPVQPLSVFAWGKEAIDEDDILRVHTLERKQAFQSFFPEVGSYVWNFWEDELGRVVSEERARWVENPVAFVSPRVNPTWEEQVRDDYMRGRLARSASLRGKF